MKSRTRKQRLYWLLELFIAGKLEPSNFCNEFFLTYGLEVGVDREVVLERDDLSSEEDGLFGELSNMAGRFSDIEADIALHPNVWYTIDDINLCVEKIRKILFKKFEKSARHDAAAHDNPSRR